MRGFLQRTIAVTTLLAAFATIGAGGIAHSDEEGPQQTQVGDRDLEGIKAALERLKAQLNDGGALQQAYEREALREEIVALRTRLGEALESQSRANAPSLSPQGSQVAVPPDVTSTGNIGEAAPRSIGEAPVPAQDPSRSAAQEQQIRKADELLKRGDIAAARIVLEHALRTGNPVVAFKLAETYDPRRIASWGVIGVRGDPQKARALYEQAHAGGVQHARQRAADLNQ
jgi:hypothetical protein